MLKRLAMHSYFFYWASVVVAGVQALPAAECPGEPTAPVKVPKVIIDNDGSNPIDIALPLLAGWDVLGASAVMGSYNIKDSLYYWNQALDSLNMSSCLPLYKGPAEPLVRTYNTFQIWQELYGTLLYEGLFEKGYTGVSPKNATVSYNETISAAEFMVQQVKAYPGEITIMEAAPLTTIANALTIWPEFAQNVKRMVIMGGFIDSQYYQVVGGKLNTNYWTDTNIFIDPEAAQIALSAGFPDLVIAGNITNNAYPTQEFFDKLIAKAGGEERIASLNTTSLAPLQSYIGSGNASEVVFPAWDELSAAVTIFPELVTSSFEAYVGIDTAYDSPFYGTMRVWPEYTHPTKGLRNAKATIINTVDIAGYFEKVEAVLLRDWTEYCATGTSTCIAVDNLCPN